MVNTLPKQKALGPHAFADKFHKTFHVEIIPILYNHSQSKKAVKKTI